MESFLKEILLKVKKNFDTLHDLTFIVPSKRAGIFLKKELLQIEQNRTLFAPKIIDIQEFISQLSGLNEIDNTQTLFEFYETYLHVHTDQEKDSFDTFRNWAQTLIYDFNEIDRYCIDHKSFFSYLSGIQDLNHWSLQKDKTQLVANYIHFWKNLPEYYSSFRNALLSKNIGYQGLLYRVATEKIDTYIKTQPSHHILVGFNALNTAEQFIFQALLEADKASIFWDADTFFFANEYHEASLFLRAYKKNWKYYQNHPFNWIQDNFSKDKNIEFIGVPKNVGQAKIAGNILSNISVSDIEKTALVLSEETLLQPILQSLPNTVGSLNITMGLPLQQVPIANFFDLLFKLHKTTTTRGFYYKDILQIINAQPANRLLGPTALLISKLITDQNIVYVTKEKIEKHISSSDHSILKVLLEPWKNVQEAIKNCKKIIFLLKDKIDADQNPLELEYLFHFHNIFNTLKSLHNNFKFITSVSSLYQLYKDILSVEKLDFIGEPHRGLQLMGMLESRCLDFETVIITTVNEGILPAGKSINSFIPYDLKRAYQLPTHKEKDAIYTYHFYRLLQRAKQIYIIYNTEDEGVGGGEKSRFLRQLEIDKRPLHKITNTLVSTAVPSIKKNLKKISKTQDILTKLKELSSNGISPSALTTYIRNPIDFYHKYILGIRETEEVEETIAANTMGTVIHNTLETLYKPFENQYLSIEMIHKMISEIPSEVRFQFSQVYSNINITQGKNLLIYEVAKKYIHNFLLSEQQELQQGNQIKIIAIESNLKTQIHIPELDFHVYIKGKVDRIDEFNGQIRVIDYKSGKVYKNDVIIMDWDQITSDYKYSKAFQILAYAHMHSSHNFFSEHNLTAGIISFKNLKEGFLQFGTKENTRGKVAYGITEAVFANFIAQLKKLIIEIHSTEIPFIEKEV